MSSPRNVNSIQGNGALPGGTADPAYRQLYERIRAGILNGQLPSGARLPPSRKLAAEAGVSRNTVLAAFDQLHAEGYIEGRGGSGTYVARVLPERTSTTDPLAMPNPNDVPAGDLSARGRLLAGTPRMPLPSLTGADPAATAFQIGLPALDAFPAGLWGRLYAARARHLDRELMRYHDPAGYRPLREAIAAHVALARGIRCTGDQVVIVSGSQQALEFCARILLDPGDPAWLEDPCYLGAKAAFTAAGARLVPIPVDDKGIDVAAGIAREPDARLAFVTPSYQFPLGVPMALERRVALIHWAARTGSWIIEDDYDSEFRYSGRPLAALHAIDRHQRVIYVGTFSKTMFPGMRLGYLIAPPSLVDGLIAAHLGTDMHAHLLDQAVLADFIVAGHFARHVRRMRVLYGQRQRLLVQEAARLGNLLRLNQSDGGLHLVGWLPPDVGDRAVAARGLEHDVHLWPLSPHCLERTLPPALLLGYAGTVDADIRQGIDVLHRLLAADKGR